MGESMSVEQEWLAELDGEDLHREPSETRKSTLKPLLRGNGRFGPESSGVAKRATRLGDEFHR